MKKIASIVIVLVLLLYLSACNSDTAPKGEMYIKKAELTKEETSLLQLVGGDMPKLYEFSVDGSVKSVKVSVYELSEGEWKKLTGIAGPFSKETSGRIALNFDNIGMGIRSSIEHVGSGLYEPEEKINFEGMASIMTSLTDKTKIEYEKEIPLVIQIHSAKDAISSPALEEVFNNPEDFEKNGYEKVYAVTCTFSQKTMQEIESTTDK